MSYSELTCKCGYKKAVSKQKYHELLRNSGPNKTDEWNCPKCDKGLSLYAPDVTARLNKMFQKVVS